jgi:putative glutamine amidotransferase
MHPLIGVPGQSLQAMDGIPEGIPQSWVMSRRYFTALSQAGGVPIMVPLLDAEPETLRALYDRLDGVFLAGGVDVSPECYGQERTELCGRTDAARDAVEIALARWAIAEGKPLLGVCRGLHVVNVAMGGTLWQDCTAFYPGSIKHDYFPTQGFARDHIAHDVDVTRGSRLSAALGGGAVAVNSMHHQGVMRLGGGLHVTAHAPDGLIEAIETPAHDGWMVAVQWHPEALVDDDARTAALFHAFIAASVAWRAAVPAPLSRPRPDARLPA